MGCGERKNPRVTLNAAARTLIQRFPLGFVATVTAEGAPSLSPKGTFLVLDDSTIGFAHIRSPGTVENLSHRAEAEVNFIDQWTRKGVRIFGKTETHERGSPRFMALFPKWEEAHPTLAHRVDAIVTISCDRVKPLTTPPYDDGATEEEMIALYKVKFAEIYP